MQHPVGKVPRWASTTNNSLLKNELGDLDVAWEILEKPEFHYRIVNFMCMNLDSVSHMRRLVRPRNNAIRLISVGELNKLKCPRKLIYEFNGPNVQNAIGAIEKRFSAAKASSESMPASILALLGPCETQYSKKQQNG